MAVLASRSLERCSRGDAGTLRACVDRRLRALLPPSSRSDDLADAIRYSLLAPGKRIRPIMTVLAAWELGGDDLRALDAGCALEMIHTASLILDDLPAMDDAKERRGQPATHIRFGQDVALLAAITLLNLAYGTIGGMAEVPAETRCRLVGILAQAVGSDGLAGGQFADLRPGTIQGVEAAAETNRRKTGSLFEAAVAIAAAVQGISDTEAAPLHHCAREIGQAYQIWDDMADQAQPCEDVGKATILSIVGREATRRRLRLHLDGAVAELQPAGALASYLQELFGAVPSVAEPA